MESVSHGGDSYSALPLDMHVPSKYLTRRYGFSLCCSSAYLYKPRDGRRGGISFDTKDQNAVYVRMLGDIQMKSKLDNCTDFKPSSISVSDLKLLDKLASKDYKIKWSSRFQSLHKTRRRHRSMVKLSPQSNSLLDQLYSQQAECLLTNLSNWNTDIFYLDILTCGRPLLHVSMHLFHQYNLIEDFNLDSLRLLHTFSLIEEGYHDNNPYHNSVHAADVTQAMHCYLQEQKLRGAVPALEVMTSLFAAMTHDLDHPGVNQAFLVATANHLAALYENTSVLENHHWRTAMCIFHESGIFQHLRNEQWKEIEYHIKSLILATDITRQQEFLSRFKKYLDNGDLDYQNNASHRHFMLQIALKCADISNPCREWHISKRWSERVCDEFFRQGDYERRLQVPVTPMCNRHATTVAKIQTGFFEYVVSPLFNEWYRFLPTSLSREMLHNIAVNKENWKEIIKENEKDVKTEVTAIEDDDDDDDDYEDVADADEESDTVETTRLPLTFTRLTNEDDTTSSLTGSRRGSCSSLSVVQELENWHPEFRRHSMPPGYLRRDITCVTIRRDSLPHTQYIRRRSLPTAMIFHTTSMDRLVGKLSPFSVDRSSGKSCSMEELLSKPKISNLSPSFEASRLIGDMSVSSEYINAKTSQSSLVKFVTQPQVKNSLEISSSTEKPPPVTVEDYSSDTFHNQVSSDIERHVMTSLSSDKLAQTLNCAAGLNSSSLTEESHESGTVPLLSKMGIILSENSDFSQNIQADGAVTSSNLESSHLSPELSSTHLANPIPSQSLSQ